MSRRVRWHQQIGMRLEEAFGPRAGEIAAELAVHFEHGRDYDRAVQYLQRAAETAVQRHAHREAIAYLRRALELCRPCRKRHSGSGTNSRSSWPSVQRSWSPGVLPPLRWAIPMPGHASCVSNWAINSSSFQPSLGCGGLRTSEGSYRRRGRFGEQLLSLAHTQG